MSRGWPVLVVITACSLWLPPAIQAQQPQQLGKIIGTVRVLRGDFTSVAVLITLEFRGAPIQSVYTDNQGRFGFGNLIANEYRVTVDDDAYKPQSINVNVNPEFSPLNIVQLTLEPRETKKTEGSLEARVEGSNPYLVDPGEYYQRYPKKTLKEFDRGVEAEKQGRTPDAVEHYEKALSYSADFYPAHNNLGSVYLARQNFDEAEKQFAAALKANQNDAQAYFNLGNVMLMTKRYPEAERQINDGLQRRPDSAFGHFLQGLLYSRLRKPDLAEKALQSALQLDAKMPQVYLQLVNLYLQLNRTPEAISELEAYLKAFPDSPLAPKARETLKRLQGNPGATENPQ
jgi:tetratricopeptide (TPR) repeat protein